MGGERVQNKKNFQGMNMDIRTIEAPQLGLRM